MSADAKEIRRLRAEIERWRDSNNRLRDEMEHQAQLNSDLNQDKQRLDFLDTLAHNKTMAIMQRGSDKDPIYWAGIEWSINTDDALSVRAAIDEAMDHHDRRTRRKLP